MAITRTSISDADSTAPMTRSDKSILAQLAALKRATTAELKLEWQTLFGVDAPVFNRAFLESRLSYRLQELSCGGLQPKTIERLAALGERLDGGDVVLRRIRADDRPVPGTRLIREYQGVEHVVTVMREGFEFEGRPYQSLSAVARHITGTRWNGWVFFGLRSTRSGS